MLEIKNVWCENLLEEFEYIRGLVDRYPCISMDTEFPGVVAKPIGMFRSAASYNYNQIKCNVDILKIIQIGITLSDMEGNRPAPVSTWQFNFPFDLENDMYSQESIELLHEAGIDFEKHKTSGIDATDFGDLVFSSGLVCNPDMHWISFHSSYDFGYFVKILTNRGIPGQESEFFRYLHKVFPNFYDIKFMAKSLKLQKSSLQDIAEDLGVERIGIQHQAGSDSLVTNSVFFQLRKQFFLREHECARYSGCLFGLDM